MNRRTTRGSLTQTARRLAAYIPTTLAARILQEGAVPPPGVPLRLAAATLFTDLSGFTLLTNELAADGPRGAEELNRVLLMTFTAMINAIHTARGAVGHFHGDAMMVYFPDDDGEAAQRALACARFMQGLMHRGYSRVETQRPDGRQSHFQLDVKIGVGYGSCAEIILGDPEQLLEFALVGPAVDEAVAAQRQSEEAEVIASRTVLERAGFTARAPYQPFMEVMPVPYAPPILFLDAYDKNRLRLLLDSAAHFLPPRLVERITNEKSAFVAEHRPVTSLFVRFEGLNFTHDEAGQQLQKYYCWAADVVARHGGPNSHLNRVLTGDKGNQLHIIFGAPVAPDAPEQALRCALALQTERPPFITGQQIGLVNGKVFACAVGSGSRREYTILGESVNLSARLVALCPEAGVLTDEATARRLGGRFDIQHWDTVGLKGFQRPVPLYLVQREKPTPSPGPGSPAPAPQRALLGRQLEQAQLFDAMDRAMRGQGGGVAITGSVGAGRSRLLAAGMHYWQERSGRLLTAVGQKQLVDVPYSLWINVWRDFFSLRHLVDLGEQAAAVVQQVQRLCPAAAGDAGLWLEALGLPVPDDLTGALGLRPDHRLERFLQLVQQCLLAAASIQPLLLAFEDLHLADPPSLSLLDAVAARWDRTPLILVLTMSSRDGLDLPLLDTPHCREIRLEDLSPTEARVLARSLLQGAELPPLLERQLGLTGDTGERVNPLFLEESIQMMLELGVLQQNETLEIQEEALERLQVPDSLHSLLLSRLDRLAAPTRTLLQVASVIGRQFDHGILAQIERDVAADILAGRLAELESAQLIRPLGTAEPGVWLFHNDMIRDVAYQSIPYARRQMLHAAVANHYVNRYRGNLQPYYPILAHHYSHTDLHEFGLEYAVAAADEARAQMAGRAAIELYTVAERHWQAMAATAKWQVLAHILLARAEMARQEGELRSASGDARRAFDLARRHHDPLFAARAANLLAELRLVATPGRPVLELADTVIEQLPRPIPPAVLARAWTIRGQALAYLGDYPAAQTSLETAVGLYRPVGDTPGHVRALLVWGNDVFGDQAAWSLARQRLDEAMAMLERLEGDGRAERAIGSLGLARVALGTDDVDLAERWLDQAEQWIDEGQLSWWRPALYVLRSRHHLRREDRASAHAALHLAASAVDEGGAPDWLPLIWLGLAQLTADNGRARHYLAQCVAAAQSRARRLDRDFCLAQVHAMGFSVPVSEATIS